MAELAHNGQRSGAALVRSVVAGARLRHGRGPAALRAAMDAAFEMQQPDTAIRLADRGAAPGCPMTSTAQLLVQRADAWWHLDEVARAARDLAEASTRSVCGDPGRRAPSG